MAEIFIGEWSLTVTNRWWLDDPTTITSGSASCEWLGVGFFTAMMSQMAAHGVDCGAFGGLVSAVLSPPDREVVWVRTPPGQPI